MILTYESQIVLNFYTIVIYILSLKKHIFLQTKVYFVPECNFSSCLWYFLALKIMFL